MTPDDFWREVTKQQRAAGYKGVSYNPDYKKEKAELEKVRNKFKNVHLVTVPIMINGDRKIVEAKYDGAYNNQSTGKPRVSILYKGKDYWIEDLSSIEILR